MKMAKLQKKRMELLTQMDKRRKARLPLDNVRGEFFKVFFFKEKQKFQFSWQVWNDNCQAHEAYQFFRKKNADKYGDFLPPPSHQGK